MDSANGMTGMDGHRGAEERAAGLFYGWYVATAVLAVMTVSAGLGFYNLSVYLKAFVAQGRFPVSAVSTATSCFFIASGISGIGVAALIERYDPRWIIATGALISSAAVFAAAHVSALWQLYGFYVLFGIGYSFSALIPGTTLVARWFVRRRSQALAYASTGLSLGGILLTPLSARLIEQQGFSGAAPWLAAIFILGIVPACLFIRPDPASMGFGPDGDPAVRDKSGATLAADGIGFEEAIRSRFFILMTVAFIFAMMAQVGMIAHQFRLVAERTGSDRIAAFAVAIMAGASIAGRLAGGWALAHIPSRNFVFALTLGQGAALVLYAFASGTTALLVMAALFGLTVGNLLMMQPLMLAEAFGLKAYGRIFSVNQFLMVAGVASGPAIMGLFYERAGGYDIACLAMAGASTLAFVFIAAAGPVRGLIDGKKNA